MSIDGEDEVRWQKLAELGDIVPSFIRYIERKLQTPDPYAASRISQALDRLSGFRDRRAVPLMIRLLRVPVGGAANRATCNLLYMGDASAIDEIRKAILETAARPFSKEQHKLLNCLIGGCLPRPYPSALHFAMIPTLRELESRVDLHESVKGYPEFVCAKIENAEQKWDGNKSEGIPVLPGNAADSSPAPRNTVAPINAGRADPPKSQSDENTQSATLTWVASVVGFAVALAVIRMALQRSRRR